MSSNIEVLKNSGYLLAARLFVRMASLPFMLYMAATLEPRLFGMFAFVLITVEILSSMGDVGLTRFGTRALIRDDSRKDRMVGIFLSIQLLTAVIMMALAYAALFFFSPEETKKELFMVAFLALFISSFIYTTEIVFTAEKRFASIAIFQVIGKVVYLALGFIALFMGYSVVAVMIAYIIGMAVEAVLRMAYMRIKVTSLSGDYSTEDFMDVVKGTLPFAVSGIAVLIYFRADTIIIGLLKGDYEVGIYSAAYSFFTFFFWLPVIMSRTLLPNMIERYQHDPDGSLRNSIAWYSNVIFAGLAIAFSVTIMAPVIFELLLPEGLYDESILVLQIIIWSIPFLMMVSVGLNALIMTGYEKIAAVALVVTTVVIIGLDLILIPAYGVDGAAVAMLVSTALWSFQHLWLLKRRVWQGRVRLVRLFFAPVLGLILMAGAGLLLINLGEIAALAGGLAVFSLVVYFSVRGGPGRSGPDEI